jgi:hypothetical protein
MVAGDVARGEVKDPRTVQRFEMRAFLALRRRAKNVQLSLVYGGDGGESVLC